MTPRLAKGFLLKIIAVLLFLIRETVANPAPGLDRNKLSFVDPSYRPVISGAKPFGVRAWLAPDGKILVSGYFTSINGQLSPYLGRLNPDGSLDQSFRPDWRSPVVASDFQSDGRIILWSNSLVRRLWPDGSQDFSFFARATPFGSPGGPTLPDRAIFADSSSSVLLFPPTTVNGIVTGPLVRVDSTGRFISGWQTNTAPNVLLRQPDGKILIGHPYFQGTTNVALKRLNPDGSLDTAFATATFDRDVTALALQPDGKILASGKFTKYGATNRARIARLYSDGSLDSSFDPGSGLLTPVSSIVPLLSGGIYISGKFTNYNGGPATNIARLTSDGKLDPTFSPPAHIAFEGDGETIRCTVQADGRLLIAGGFSILSQRQFGIARLESDGALDLSFRPELNFNPSLPAVAGRDQGGLFAATWDTDADLQISGVVQVVTASGGIDPTFRPLKTASAPIAILEQSDGQIILGIPGKKEGSSAKTQPAVARYSQLGEPDSSFVVDLAPSIQPLPIANPLLIQNNGNILIAATDNPLKLVDHTGALVRTFPTDWTDSIRAAVELDGGRLLLGGSGFYVSGVWCGPLARLTADGQLDTVFNPAFTNSIANRIHLYPNGKILVAGSLRPLPRQNSDPTFGLVRLNPDGSLDPSFNSPPISWTIDPSPSIHTFIIQSDGKIVVAGLFDMIGGVARRSIARLEENGAVDSTFLLPLNDTVNYIVPEAGGQSMIIAGPFTIADGFPVAGFARIFFSPQSSPEKRDLRFLGSRIENSNFLTLVRGSETDPTVIEASTNLVDWTGYFSGKSDFILIDAKPRSNALPPQRAFRLKLP